MAPKRHGGPAQPAGKGYVKSDRPGERRAFGVTGPASGGEPPDDVAPEEAPDLPRPQVCDATASTSADSPPEPDSLPEPEAMPEPAPEPEPETAQPVAAEIPSPAIPAAMEAAASAPLDGAVSASASLIGSVAGGLGLAALAGGGIVVIGLGAALGAWHSVAVANRYLSRR